MLFVHRSPSWLRSPSALNRPRWSARRRTIVSSEPVEIVCAGLVLAPEPQKVSSSGQAFGIQRGDRAVGGDRHANGASPLRVPGGPEWHTPPSAAVPVFDEGLVGRRVLPGHGGAIACV